MFKFFRTTSIFGILFFSHLSSFGSQTPPLSENKILLQLKEDIKNIPNSSSFSAITDRWTNQYGSLAIEPLYQLTLDQTLDENIRYMTLMTMVRMGGIQVFPKINNLLKDSSWNIKVGCLRAIRMIQSAQPEETHQFGQIELDRFRILLKDKALVVRNETVLTISALNSNAFTPELIEALHSSHNYNNGKPLWVPQKILRILAVQNTSEKTAIALLPLLENIKDPAFLELTIQTLEKISPNLPQLKINASLEQKILTWKTHLRKKKETLL